jgi:hypothetical protein
MEIIFDMPTPELQKAAEDKFVKWAEQQDKFTQQQEKLNDEENT